MRASFLLFFGLGLHIDAFWRMTCDHSIVTARIDPIASLGQISSHVHAVTGAANFDYSVDFAKLAASTCTTCHVKQDKSAYWVPQLYHQTRDGSFSAVKQTGGITSYYLLRGEPGPSGIVKAFPQGLRIIAGDALRRSFDNSDVRDRATGFSCLGGNGYSRGLSTITNCPQGLRQEIFFPNCWDGINLDSADHKSHMAYSGDDGNGKCPASHPVKLVSIFYEVMWDINEFKNDWWKGSTPPFLFAQGDPTGFGSHGDFISGWNEDFLQAAMQQCSASSGRIEDCPLFDIDYSAANTCLWTGQLKTTEDVFGRTSRLAKLPGCNSVQSGPQRAVQSDCSGSTLPNIVDTLAVISSFARVNTSVSAMNLSSRPRPTISNSISRPANMSRAILPASIDHTTRVVEPRKSFIFFPNTTLHLVVPTSSVEPETTRHSIALNTSTTSETFFEPTTTTDPSLSVPSTPTKSRRYLTTSIGPPILTDPDPFQTATLLPSSPKKKGQQLEVVKKTYFDHGSITKVYTLAHLARPTPSKVSLPLIPSLLPLFPNSTNATRWQLPDQSKKSVLNERGHTRRP